MQKRNINIFIGTLCLASAISVGNLVINSERNPQIENIKIESESKENSDDEQLLYVEIQEKLRKLGISFDITKDQTSKKIQDITIYKMGVNEESFEEIPEEIYDKINQLLKDKSINSLSVYFSKDDTFQYDKLSLENIKNFTTLASDLTPSLQSFLKNKQIENFSISLVDNPKEWLEFIEKNNFKVKTLLLKVRKTKLTTEDLEKLPINDTVTYLIDTCSDDEFSCNIKLNPTTQKLVIYFDSFVDGNTINLKEINISSTNPALQITLASNPDWTTVIADESTKMNIPENANLSLKNIVTEDKNLIETENYQQLRK